MTRGEFLGVLEDLMGADPGSLADSDSRDTVAGWSSLVDVQILGVVQSELGIEADEKLAECETVGELLNALASRSAFSA